MYTCGPLIYRKVTSKFSEERKVFLFSFNLLTFGGLCWVLVAGHGLSIVAESGDHSLVVVRELLFVLASLFTEYRFEAQGLQ